MLAFLNEHAAAFYGLAALVALGLAALSKQHVIVKFALILLFDWVAYNLLVEMNGFARAPLLIPTFDAAVGIWLGGLAWANASRVGGAVFGLFVVVCACWFAAIWSHAEASYLCYLVANLIFLSQIAIVGGAGAWGYLVDRRASGHLRAHPHPARG